jgi:hypothetical protein
MNTSTSTDSTLSGALPTIESIPAPTATISLTKYDAPDSSNGTIVFGTLGLLLALAAVVVAVLQLRRTKRRRQARVVQVYELVW